jgi:hypothetical protein
MVLLLLVLAVQHRLLLKAMKQLLVMPMFIQQRIAGTGAVRIFKQRQLITLFLLRTAAIGTGQVGDVSAVIASAGVSVTGVEGTGQISQLTVWGPVIPGQDAEWAVIDDSQTPGWSEIDDSQTPNWKEVA